MIRDYYVADLGIRIDTDEMYFHEMFSAYASDIDRVDMSVRLMTFDNIDVVGTPIVERDSMVVTKVDNRTIAYYFSDNECYGAIKYNDDYSDTEVYLRAETHYYALTRYDVGYLLFGALFGYRLTFFDGICLHGSCIRYGNSAIIFTAPSGIGKSTQANLWHDVYGDKVSLINDDKPALRMIDGKLICYGTPFSGKHHLNSNDSAPVKTIINVTRATSDSIEPLSNKDSVVLLCEEMTRSMLNNRINMQSIKVISAIISSTPIFRLHCTPTPSAVHTTMAAIHHLL